MIASSISSPTPPCSPGAAEVIRRWQNKPRGLENRCGTVAVGNGWHEANEDPLNSRTGGPERLVMGAEGSRST